MLKSDQEGPIEELLPVSAVVPTQTKILSGHTRTCDHTMWMHGLQQLADQERSRTRGTLIHSRQPFAVFGVAS